MGMQALEEGGLEDDKLDEHEQLLLKFLEDKDAQALKQMLKRTIKQEMPEQHGQKNW